MDVASAVVAIILLQLKQMHGIKKWCGGCCDSLWWFSERVNMKQYKVSYSMRTTMIEKETILQKL